MAFLGRSFLFLIAILTAVRAQASLPPEGMIRSGAWDALKRCDRSRASFWAKELEKLDPDQALLYRLAWLETSRPVSPSNSSDPPTDAWTWKRSTEIWADEKGLEGGSCGESEAKRSSSYSSLPKAIIEAELDPALRRYASARPALREALRGFALFEWLQGRKLTLSEETRFESERSKTENCEWHALQALHAEKEDVSTLGRLATQCHSPNSLLWAIVKTRAGDLLLKAGESQGAFASFHSALAYMPDRKMPNPLAYRIAVSGILSGADDEVIYRAAYQALSPDDAISPLLQSGLSSMICDKMSETHAIRSIATLRKVFTAGAIIPATLKLTENCEASQLSALWPSLFNETKDPKDRSRILVRALTSAIARNDASGKSHSLRELFALSKNHPSLARHAFWSALRNSRSEKNFAAIRDLVNRYRKSAHWGSADELRLKYLLRPGNPASSPVSGDALQVSSSESKSPIRLPMALLAEPLSIHAEVPTEFTALLKRDLDR